MADNRILSRLSRADFRLLEPHLEAVDLPLRRQLEARKKRIDQVYFIESGLASVVANGTSKPSIEIGIIGREGMTGLAIVLGHDRAHHATFVQAAGRAHRYSTPPGILVQQHSGTDNRFRGFRVRGRDRRGTQNHKSMSIKTPR